jgi:hypothetical protein
MSDTPPADPAPVDAKPWYLSKTILLGIVGTILSLLAAFHVVLPASVTADSISDAIVTTVPILLMIAAHAKSTTVVTPTKAAADVINAKAATDAAVLAASPKN